MNRFHYPASLLIISAALFGSACIRRVSVPPVLPTDEIISTDDLINRVNAYDKVKTLGLQCTVSVRNYFTGVASKADDFPAGDGLVRLKKPENILMKVTAPVLNSPVADMVSDGKTFRLALYFPRDRKRFLFGSNLKDYERIGADESHESDNPDVAKAGGLVNMRPQHVTDALAIKPILLSDGVQVFREELKQDESDRNKRRVIKSYSVLYVVERNEKGIFELRRKLWFDRTQHGTPLTRLQIFDNGSGRLASEVTYSEWAKVGSSDLPWPTKIVINRANDGYQMTLILEKELIEPDLELPSTTFILENTHKFEEIDLDAPRKSSAGQVRKPGQNQSNR